MAKFCKVRDRECSIGDARNGLSKLVHEAEAGRPVRLTRHGKSVAVLVSFDEFQRIPAAKPDFWVALQRFRKTVNLSNLELGPEYFARLRDPGTGREPGD